MEDLEPFINRLTRSDEKERARLLAYAGKLPDRTRLRACQQAMDFIFLQQNKQYLHYGKSCLFYCGFIIALRRIRVADTQGMKRKGSSKVAKSIAEIRRDRMEILRKRKTSRSNTRLRLSKYLAEIWEARNSGYSLQMICEWLQQAHQIKVSREYLRRLLQNAD